MKKTGIALIVIAFAAFSGMFSGCDANKSAQNGTTSKKDPVLLNFPGKETVGKSEFEYVYQKNNGGWEAVKSHSQDQYQEYLDLYINFKRKVLEAKSMGLHESEAFKTEFEGYRKQLAQPYLVEKSVQEKLINEAYERNKELVAASHILIMCSAEASAADTAKAFAKANALRDSIVNKGMAFADVAKKFSEDPSAKQNDGFLGYFGVFDMVYPFESGAYNTSVGKVSQPVRSGYGYHLIQVKDRIKNTGKKSSAHLIIRVGAQYSAKTDEQALEKMDEIYSQLKGGADWDELCTKYSDDPNTARKGGDLGNGRLIPEMEDLKRSMGKGDISKPFKSSFGHHILKVTDVEPVKDFAEAKTEIKSRVARDARSTLSREVLITRVKRDYNLKMNDETVAKLVKAVEDQKQEAAYNRGFWRPVDTLHKDLYDLPVYSLGKDENAHTGTLKDFMDHYTKARKGFEGTTVAEATGKFMEAFIEDEMLAFEERQLPKKHREYRELLKEYRDGILLFTLTEDKVWRKAVEDTVGLEKYYNDNMEKFRAGERVKVTEYISEKREIIDLVERLLAKNTTESDIDSTVNKTSALNCRIRTQTYEKEKAAKEEIMFDKPIGFRSPIMEYGKAWRLLVLVEKIPAGQKSFSDAKSEAITLYQNYLEENWLKELKSKYPVTVNDKVFQELYK